MDEAGIQIIGSSTHNFLRKNSKNQSSFIPNKQDKSKWWISTHYNDPLAQNESSSHTNCDQTKTHSLWHGEARKHGCTDIRQTKQPRKVSPSWKGKMAATVCLEGGKIEEREEEKGGTVMETPKPRASLRTACFVFWFFSVKIFEREGKWERQRERGEREKKRVLLDWWRRESWFVD